MGSFLIEMRMLQGSVLLAISREARWLDEVLKEATCEPLPLA